MAKIDDRIEEVQKGFQSPSFTSGTTWVEDAQMEACQVRRKSAGQTHHRLFYVSIGEYGQTPTTFYGHKFTDALVKVEKWRGTYVKNTKGPRKQAAG
jgi:hypothetical protein